MNDYLQNATLRQLLKTLNIPVPVPPILKRNLNPYQADEFQEKSIAVFGKETEFLKEFQKIITEYTSHQTIYADKLDAVVVSCVGINSFMELEDIFSELKNVLGKINANGRILIVSETDNSSAVSFTLQKSLEGFTRALSKEIGGKKGVTVNQLKIEHYEIKPDAIVHASLFFLSNKSSFITGQVVPLCSITGAVFTSIDQLLKNKTAIVTGGARGIGAAAARALAREGAKVIIIDIPASEQEARLLADEIDGVVLLKDITSADALHEIRAYILENFGGLDILVNNAGITKDKTLAKMSLDQWRAVLAVNLKAVMDLSNTFIDNGFNAHAKIVSLSSISGIAGNVGQTNYSLTKAGVIGFTQYLAKHQKDIYANAVAPGFIETKMTENLPFLVKEGGRRLSTLKQGGLPEDVAELICFLASPLSDAINGECVRVCGGSMIGA